MTLEYLKDFLFILFVVVFGFSFIVIPTISLLFSIFYYSRKFSYININLYLFYYNIPLVIFYLFMDTFFIDINLLYYVICIFIYYLPLVFLINRNILGLVSWFYYIKTSIIFYFILGMVYIVFYLV